MNKTFSEYLKENPIPSYVKVKNAEDTSDEKCGICGSWLAHWEKLTKKTAKQCSIFMCEEELNDDGNIEGGHLEKIGSNNEELFIAPICKKHNNPSNKEIFEVLESDLVSAIKCE